MLRKLVARAGRVWRRNEEGATAVEFALMATVFFWVFIGIVEMGLLMIFNNGVEDGVDRAARLIRTGQADKQGIDKDQFRNRICDMVVLKTACRSNLVVDVREYPDFASINPPAPEWDADNNLQLQSQFEKGGPRRVILVRAFYDWKFITPMIGALAGNTGHGTFLLSAATAFRNEPYVK